MPDSGIWQLRAAYLKNTWWPAVIVLFVAGCSTTVDVAPTTQKPSKEAFNAALDITLAERVSTEKVTKHVGAYGVRSEVQEVSTSKFGGDGRVADMQCVKMGMKNTNKDLNFFSTSQFWSDVVRVKKEISLYDIFESDIYDRILENKIDFIVAAYHQKFDVQSHFVEYYIEGVFVDENREVASEATIDVRNKTLLNASKFVYEGGFGVGHLLFVIPVVGWSKPSSDPCEMIGETAGNVLAQSRSGSQPRVVVVAAKQSPYAVTAHQTGQMSKSQLDNCIRDTQQCEDLDLDILYANAYKQDQIRAWSSYCLAAQLGHPKSRLVVANYYRNGIPPVSRDLVKAFTWYSLAEQDGISWAGANREGVKKTMTPAQIRDAERLLGEWEPNPRECLQEARTSN